MHVVHAAILCALLEENFNLKHAYFSLDTSSFQLLLNAIRWKYRTKSRYLPSRCKVANRLNNVMQMFLKLIFCCLISFKLFMLVDLLSISVDVGHQFLKVATRNVSWYVEP